MSNENSSTHKVIVYIDGFNCYFGLKESQWQCYYWLDYAKLAHKLASKIMAENPTLVATKYFTARISAPEDKRRRQTTFLEALEAHATRNSTMGIIEKISILVLGVADQILFRMKSRQTLISR